jgi:hypothetical protein
MIRKLIYRIALLGMIAALFSVAVPASAQEAWKAYLFNSNTAQIVQVGPEGEQAAYSLGVNPDAGEYLSGFDLSITADGARAAFCFVSNVPSADGSTLTTQATYVLRDIVAQQDIVRLNMGSPLTCLTGKNAFSPDESRLALAKVNSFPGDANADPNTPFWSLQIIDPLTGVAFAELNQRSLQLVAEDIDPMLANNPMIPLVITTGDNGLIFTAGMFASEGRLGTAFRWDFNANTLTPVEPWGKYGLSYQGAMGEFAYADFDPALPVGEPGGPMANNNLVRVRAADGADTTVFVGGADWVVTNTVFVNEGRDLAISLLESFVPNNDPQSTQKIRWVLLKRDGSLVDLYTDPDYSALVPVSAGYLLLAQDFPRDQSATFPSYTLTVAEGTEQRLIWQSPAVEGWQNWEIAWATPVSAQADLPAFTPVK